APAAVHQPEVALDPGTGRFGLRQGAIQPDEVEGAADPRDAGDEMSPAQQQIRPIGQPTGHGDSNFTVNPRPASPRQALSSNAARGPRPGRSYCRLRPVM